MSKNLPAHGHHSGKKTATCGCQASHCCLSCELPVCIFDLPLKTQQLLHRKQLVKEMRAAGMYVREIAVELGVSQRALFPRGTKT